MALPRARGRGKVSARRSPFASNHVTSATFTVGTENTNAINVAIQLKGPDGGDLTTPGVVMMYLSDDVNGQSLAASAPTGGWAIGTDGLLIPIVANKCAMFTSETDGDIDVTITESSGKTFYLVLVYPDGSIETEAVTFAA